MVLLRLHPLGVVFVVVAAVTMTPIGCTRTTPTPYAFKPSNYNDVKETKYDYPDVNNVEVDFPTDDGQISAVENVVYVDKSEYDELAKSSASDPDGNREPLDARPPTLEQFSRLGAIGPAELYRLLALGRQPTNVGLQFGGILNKITDTLPSSMDNVDHCPDRPEIGIQC